MFEIKRWETCGKCWKCFRKNSIRRRKITISKEIDTFLKQPKLKMAASTIYSIKKMKEIDRTLYNHLLEEYSTLNKLILEDVDFLDSYYGPALELIPEKYQYYVKTRLDYFGVDVGPSKSIESFNLYG